MKTFRYTARNSSGAVFEDTIHSESRVHAINQLRSKGLYVTGIKEEKQGIRLFKKGIDTRQLILFCRQMAFLLGAGITTYNSLSLLKNSSTNKEYVRCIDGLMKSVQDGLVLSEAMAMQKENFPDVVVYQVRSGEDGGFVEKVLNNVAKQLEKDQSFKKRLTTALIYPSIVLIATIGMVYYLSVNVVPTISTLIEDFGGELPLATRFVVRASNIINRCIPFVAILVLGLILAYKYFYSKPKTGELIDRHKINLKLIGNILRQISISRFCRTLGSLLDNGVSITNSLSISGKVMGNKYLASKIEDVKRNITQDGWELSYALQQTGEFSDTISQLVSVGEETARVPEVLNMLAEQLEDEVDTTIVRAMTYIEPALIVVLALVVGTVVISMFLPMFSLLDQF